MTKINPNNNNTIWLYKSARTDDIYDFFSGNLSEVMNRVNLFAADAEKLTECGFFHKVKGLEHPNMQTPFNQIACCLCCRQLPAGLGAILLFFLDEFNF